jgi:hypothetical protein
MNQCACVRSAPLGTLAYSSNPPNISPSRSTQSRKPLAYTSCKSFDLTHTLVRPNCESRVPCGFRGARNRGVSIWNVGEAPGRSGSGRR